MSCYQFPLNTVIPTSVYKVGFTDYHNLMSKMFQTVGQTLTSLNCCLAETRQTRPQALAILSVQKSGRGWDVRFEWDSPCDLTTLYIFLSSLLHRFSLNCFRGFCFGCSLCNWKCPLSPSSLRLQTVFIVCIVFRR